MWKREGRVCGLLHGVALLMVTLLAHGEYMCTHVYSQTSPHRPTIGPTLNGSFREMVGLES